MAFGERFLVYPGHFPQQHSGETWGDHALTIDFAGGPYRFCGLSPTQTTALRQRYGALCLANDNVEPAVDTRMLRCARTDFRDLDLIDTRYALDRDRTAHSLSLVNHHLMARLDWQPGLRAALWTPDTAALLDEHAFDNFFRMLVAHRLLDCGGVLLHSAAVVVRQRAFVFSGHSGAGKTTVSRLALAAGHEVLSDDINAISVNADGVWVERLPYAGDLGRTAPPASGRYPLAGLLRLRQARHNAIVPISLAEAYAALLANAPFVNTDHHSDTRLAANLEEILARIPARILDFRRDGGFWDLLDRQF